MTGNGSDQIEERLTLHSRLSDIAQLPVWIESIASRYSVPSQTHYAMDLCLEEVLVNIIRHGYGREADFPIRVCFKIPRPGDYLFIVEDDAPRFNPLEVPELPAIDADEEMHLGGQGIRLLRRFANTLNYETTPTGNQLHIGFTSYSSLRTSQNN
jgi:serine/threonine-protein kinase RsbW